MWWALAVAVAIFAGVIVARFRSRWVQPWRDLDRLADDVINSRTPATFLLDGNPFARRIGIALEDVFLKQRDLSRRAAQGELDMRTILGALRDGVAVIDNERHVRLLNKAARRMFAPGGEVDGATTLATFRDSEVARQIDETLRGGTAASGSMNIDGAKRIAVTSLPIEDENGGANGVLVLFHDVTELQKIEQVRRDFVSNVSHELRTPLSIFRGYVETLLEEPELGADERGRILRVLEKHSARLNSLVDDLLSLAQLEAPHAKLNFAPVSLAGLVERVVNDWQRKAAKREVTIVASLEEELPEIEADESRLEEVIHNLLENAVKYSARGGRVAVSAKRAEQQVELAVADNGSGISAADLPRIFERFYRADKARTRELGGTGLGLAIVKQIAEMHGGKVEAQSALGAGTTVRVLLPIVR